MIVVLRALKIDDKIKSEVKVGTIRVGKIIVLATSDLIILKELTDCLINSLATAGKLENKMLNHSPCMKKYQAERIQKMIQYCQSLSFKLRNR